MTSDPGSSRATPNSVSTPTYSRPQGAGSGDGDYDASIELGRGRAVEIGERFGDEHVAGHARVTVGVATGRRDLDAGLRLLEEAVQLARGTGQPEVVARAFNAMGYICRGEVPARAGRCVLRGRARATAPSHTSDLWRINMLALSGLSFLAQGRFDDASRRRPRSWTTRGSRPGHITRHWSCSRSCGRGGGPGRARRARRDQHRRPAARRVRCRRRPGCGARRDRLAGPHDRGGRDATEATPQEAIERDDDGGVSRLVFWRRLAELETGVPTDVAGPYALALAGRWEQAADEWTRRGQPYETALALSQSGDVAALRRAHAELQRIGARPLAALVARELRDLGARDIPRGPRRSTPRERRRADDARAGCARAPRRRATQRRHRRPARRVAPYGRPPRLVDPPEARCAQPG